MQKRWIKWGLAGGFLLAFILIAMNLNHMTGIDHAVYDAFKAIQSPFATGFFTLCTNLVSPIVLLVLTFALVAALPAKEYRIPILINLSVAVLLNLVLKQLFVRPRPTDVIQFVIEAGHSFPSGHTMAGTCFYGFLIYLLWQLCTRKKIRNLLIAVLTAVILLIASSRVYLGAHYFTDVFGGICISIVYLIVLTSAIDLFLNHDETLLKNRLQPNKRNRMLFSFIYASEGIHKGFTTERNMVIHFSVMTAVIVFGAILGLSRGEWMVCIILFGLVLMAELFNTAIETIVDILCPVIDPRAKIAKDTAAGAVLIAAIASAIIGLIIFIPKLILLIQNEL